MTINIVGRIPGSSMAYPVCGHAEESDVYAIIECPLAIQIWDRCGLDENLWVLKQRSLRDCLEKVCISLDYELVGVFMPVMWNVRMPEIALSLGRRIVPWGFWAYELSLL